jgi:hypothetical protein
MTEHEKAVAGDLQQVEHKKARSFSILPLCSFDAKHMTVDTTVLSGLLMRVAKRKSSPKCAKLSDFLDNKRAHWAECSSLRKAKKAMEATCGAPVSEC